ncbi:MULTISPECIES: FeoA family protein [Allobranchiibius]|uniref:Ferrous iron transport protein A n=1 Tax=Allobranchiibius huperziae TaxID=1874116 RepID=A0A853D953_9MICO|nr:ferrous iron transport protein A [Allobranchiibius huperziae]
MSLTSVLTQRSRPRSGDVVDRGLTGSVQQATLADVRPGSDAMVLGYDDAVDPRTARRLSDLGFAPGEAVTVVRRAPMRDPIVFRVADYEIALRARQAAGILVGPLA